MLEAKINRLIRHIDQYQQQIFPISSNTTRRLLDKLKEQLAAILSESKESEPQDLTKALLASLRGVPKVIQDLVLSTLSLAAHKSRVLNQHTLLTQWKIEPTISDRSMLLQSAVLQPLSSPSRDSSVTKEIDTVKKLLTTNLESIPQVLEGLSNLSVSTIKLLQGLFLVASNEVNSSIFNPELDNIREIILMNVEIPWGNLCDVSKRELVDQISSLSITSIVDFCEQQPIQIFHNARVFTAQLINKIMGLSSDYKTKIGILAKIGKLEDHNLFIDTAQIRCYTRFQLLSESLYTALHLWAQRNFANITDSAGFDSCVETIRNSELSFDMISNLLERISELEKQQELLNECESIIVRSGLVADYHDVPKIRDFLAGFAARFRQNEKSITKFNSAVSQVILKFIPEAPNTGYLHGWLRRQTVLPNNRARPTLIERLQAVAGDTPIQRAYHLWQAAQILGLFPSEVSAILHQIMDTIENDNSFIDCIFLNNFLTSGDFLYKLNLEIAISKFVDDNKVEIPLHQYGFGTTAAINAWKADLLNLELAKKALEHRHLSNDIKFKFAKTLEDVLKDKRSSADFIPLIDYVTNLTAKLQPVEDKTEEPADPLGTATRKFRSTLGKVSQRFKPQSQRPTILTLPIVSVPDWLGDDNIEDLLVIYEKLPEITKPTAMGIITSLLVIKDARYKITSNIVLSETDAVDNDFLLIKANEKGQYKVSVKFKRAIIHQPDTPTYGRTSQSSWLLTDLIVSIKQTLNCIESPSLNHPELYPFLQKILAMLMPALEQKVSYLSNENDRIFDSDIGKAARQVLIKKAQLCVMQAARDIPRLQTHLSSGVMNIPELVALGTAVQEGLKEADAVFKIVLREVDPLTGKIEPFKGIDKCLEPLYKKGAIESEFIITLKVLLGYIQRHLAEKQNLIQQKLANRGLEMELESINTNFAKLQEYVTHEVFGAGRLINLLPATAVTIEDQGSSTEFTREQMEDVTRVYGIFMQNVTKHLKAIEETFAKCLTQQQAPDQAAKPAAVLVTATL